VRSLPVSQNYFRRVSKINNSDSSSFTSAHSFFTAEAVLISSGLISPEDSSVKVSVEIIFFWTAVSNASSYYLQIANSSGICNLVLDLVIVGDTSCIIGGFDHSKAYYRHLSFSLKTVSSFAAENCSELYSFTTITSLTSVPTVSTPLKDATKTKLKISDFQGQNRSLITDLKPVPEVYEIPIDGLIW
jgi:hypothetical protein